MKHLILSVFLILCGCYEPNKSVESKSLEAYFKKAKIPAVILAKVSKDGKRNIYAFGPSRWKLKDTVSENHIFRIFSMTKPIITVAALQLVENGDISLNEPLNEILPEMVKIPILKNGNTLYNSNKPITLKQLLTHTSGFGYDFISKDLRNFKDDSYNYLDKPRLFESGEDWAYGTSIEWVGKVIEKISGKSLEEYITENIINPLEMHSTFFEIPNDMEKNLVSWGVRNNDLKEVSELPLINKSRRRNNKAKTLYSTVNDYLNFLECILNNGSFRAKRILKAETVDLMFKNNLPKEMTLDYGIIEDENPIENFLDSNDVWGLGWALEANKKEPFRPQGTAYWTGSANTYFTIDYKKGVALVYFSQILPFNDKESVKFYKYFEKQVFSK